MDMRSREVSEEMQQGTPQGDSQHGGQQHGKGKVWHGEKSHFGQTSPSWGLLWRWRPMGNRKTS